MVDFIQVRTTGVVKTKAALKRFQKIPELTGNALDKWGKLLERDVKNSARTHGIKSFTGNLFGNGIRWRSNRRGSKVGHLEIVDYGVYLDSMKPHFVSIKRSRPRLLAWSLQANNGAIRGMANEVASGRRQRMGIYVTPHPYISYGFGRARTRLKAIIEAEMKSLKA